MHIIGDVTGKQCILIDDIVDSGGTLCNAADALLARGAASVCAYATHGVLSNNAEQRISASNLGSLTLMDSIPPVAANPNTKLRYLSIAPLLGEAIRRISEEQSVSSLFD
jgi:ribose-phosphate pyrophosphokinase